MENTIADLHLIRDFARIYSDGTVYVHEGAGAGSSAVLFSISAAGSAELTVRVPWADLDTLGISVIPAEGSVGRKLRFP